MDHVRGIMNYMIPIIKSAVFNDLTIVCSDSFLSTAVARLAADPGIGAVGGVFTGRDGGGLVGALQRNEYARYAREIGRRHGAARVLTGTATLFRAGVLREVAAARGRTLPGRPGAVYDPAALTEDNEITLAVRTLGHRIVSPRECVVVTEVMTTWADLWHHRRHTTEHPQDVPAHLLLRQETNHVTQASRPGLLVEKGEHGAQHMPHIRHEGYGLRI